MRWTALLGPLTILTLVSLGPLAPRLDAAEVESHAHLLSDRVAGCEHFAFQRAKVPEGLGGPAREAAKSWHVSMCVDRDGTAFVLDAENCQIYRIRQGTVRLLAGDGIRGYRDGPADRARFDFGVGSYQDADIKCDAAGNLYVSEGLPGRLRRVARDPNGAWWVTTVAGGGSRMPREGETIPATEMQVGCTSRFALAPDGTVYFATHSGVYRVAAGHGSLVLARERMPAGIPKSIHDWHVGGSHITPDGWFYWLPGGGPNLYRLHVPTGRAEKVAGVDRVVAGLDGPTLGETGFHTVFIVYSPHADVMFTGGGDEPILRRIAAGRAMHLQKDGTFLPNGKANGWRLYSPLCLDGDGRLYTETGSYAWGGMVVRVRFAAEASASAANQRGAERGPAPAPSTPAADHFWASATGATIGASPEAIQRQPSGAYGAGVYLVAWSEGSRQADKSGADICCARIDSRSGDRLDVEGIRITTAPDLQQWPRVAFDGKNFLVVWEDFRNGLDYDVYAARVTPEGRVLDPGGRVVAAGGWNQCRPDVAFAAGRYLIVWMDARTYPVYGIRAARMDLDGEVLDPGGVPLDVEDEARIAAVRPPGPEWLGEYDYWWNPLSSRYLPRVASDGRRCLVVYVREYPFAENPRPSPTALLVDPGTANVVAGPVRLPGGAYATAAPCATPGGWTVILADHASGWGLSARLAAVRLDDELKTEDAFAVAHSGQPDRLPVELVEKTLIPDGAVPLNPGKGALCFWQPGAAWNGREVVAALDFGWRDRRDPSAITHVIASNRLLPGANRFAAETSRVVAGGDPAGAVVANPALVAGPDGDVLLLFENDTAIDHQRIEHLLLRGR